MKNKKNIPRFRKGNLAEGGSNWILVTGPGDKAEWQYPCFAGVVVFAKKDENNDAWPVGMYSDTWSSAAFKKSSLSINKIMQQAIEK